MPSVSVRCLQFLSALPTPQYGWIWGDCVNRLVLLLAHRHHGTKCGCDPARLWWIHQNVGERGKYTAAAMHTHSFILEWIEGHTSTHVNMRGFGVSAANRLFCAFHTMQSMGVIPQGSDESTKTQADVGNTPSTPPPRSAHPHIPLARIEISPAHPLSLNIHPHELKDTHQQTCQRTCCFKFPKTCKQSITNPAKNLPYAGTFLLTTEHDLHSTCSTCVISIPFTHHSIPVVLPKRAACLVSK